MGANQSWGQPGNCHTLQDQIVEALHDIHRASRRLSTDHPRNLWRADGTKKRTAEAMLRQRRTPREPCPACRIGEAAQERAITTLVLHLDDQDIQEAVEHSSFLCLPDLVSALESTRVLKQAQKLLDLAEFKLRRLEEELAQLIRKRDYRFSYEPRGTEQTSWVRAIGQLVGWPKK